MAYHISHLDNVTLKKQLYFFDANMWIKILKPPFNLKGRDKKYLEFFEKFKSSAVHPKIAVTSLVLGEVINRIMREVAMSKYLKQEGLEPGKVNKGYYKEVYRGTDHFKGQYALLCDDIKGYHNKYEFVSDSFGEDIRTKDILTRPAYGLDFNDNYYVLLAKKYGFPIITDDGDFFVEDVEVMTYNDTLYQRGKNAVIVKSLTSTTNLEGETATG